MVIKLNYLVVPLSSFTLYPFYVLLFKFFIVYGNGNSVLVQNVVRRLTGVRVGRTFLKFLFKNIFNVWCTVLTDRQNTSKNLINNSNTTPLEMRTFGAHLAHPWYGQRHCLPILIQIICISSRSSYIPFERPLRTFYLTYWTVIVNLTQSKS